MKDITFEWKRDRIDGCSRCSPAPGVSCSARKYHLLPVFYFEVSIDAGGKWGGSRKTLSAARAECERFVRMYLAAEGGK